MIRLAGALTIMVIAACTAACSSKEETPPGMDLASMQMATAAQGSCPIDAVKMCQAEGGSASPSPQPAMTNSYGPPNMPESIEFQIPAGQAIKLMCYYDPQHTSVYRADATPDAPLTDNSVEYMKKQGFCVNK
ncbi:hypothetical protein [Candidatus Binatus sp.]|uniref:hypothetical protein n=1 Tax=Candidatus Binatus sp. TaxID=2811406 RepID=UPI003C52165F